MVRGGVKWNLLFTEQTENEPDKESYKRSTKEAGTTGAKEESIKERVARSIKLSSTISRVITCEV